jgi:hypothetical protein
LNPRSHEAQPRKAQESHLEKGELQKPTQGKKAAKPTKMARKS